MSGTEPELERLRDDLDELATTMQPPPMVDATAVYARWRRRRRRSRVVMACAAVATIGIGVTALLTAPWDGPEQSTIVSGQGASRDPFVDTFDYDGACPADNRRDGSCPIGRRGQEEWQRLVAAFDESLRISPIQLACSSQDDGSWGCGFQAYLGDESSHPPFFRPDGTVVDHGPPDAEDVRATWPQIFFSLEVPAQPDEATPRVGCWHDAGLVPSGKCNPDEGESYDIVRGDGATASGKFWRMPRDSSLGTSILAALERWAEDY